MFSFTIEKSMFPILKDTSGLPGAAGAEAADEVAAVWAGAAILAPQLPQNNAPSSSCVPQFGQNIINPPVKFIKN